MLIRLTIQSHDSPIKGKLRKQINNFVHFKVAIKLTAKP